MVYLARAFGKGRISSLKRISQDEDISFDYLEKIISKLEKAGLIKAKKGVQGGYFLTRQPKKITAGEIIRLLEGTMAPVKCVAKERKERFYCPRKKFCPTKNVWQKVQDSLNYTLDSITLADLAKKQYAKKIRKNLS
jgi:Rrf2 family protein